MAERVVETGSKCAVIAARTAMIRIHRRDEVTKRRDGLIACDECRPLPRRRTPQDLLPQYRCDICPRPHIDRERYVRCVVRILHAGCARRFVRRCERRIHTHRDVRQFRSDHLACDCAGAQDSDDPLLCAVDDRGLHP